MCVSRLCSGQGKHETALYHGLKVGANDYDVENTEPSEVVCLKICEHDSKYLVLCELFGSI